MIKGARGKHLRRMHLTAEEERILAGEEGEAKRKAMEILVALGDVFGADRLIPISSAQISGVSYKTVGDAGLEWIESMRGAKVSVLTAINPIGMDLELWRVMGVPGEFAEKQRRIVDALVSMGAVPSCTCTPYLAGIVPAFGEHVAWAESSAVCYANSVLGARTNREGGPSALAAAIIGKTPNYGYHLDENREPTSLIEVSAKLEEASDYSALAYWTGLELGNSVPYFTGLPRPSVDDLKAMCAAVAASSGVAMFHVEGATPEARRRPKDAERLSFTEAELKATYERLTTLNSGPVDLVAVGCPHASLSELAQIAELLKGRRVAEGTRLWVFTSAPVKRLAERAGVVAAIEAAGGLVLSDCCMVVSPVEELGVRTIATNSAKAAHYSAAVSGLRVLFAGLKELVNVAAAGEVS